MRSALIVLLLSTFAAAAGPPVQCPTVSLLNIDKGEYEARPGVKFQLEGYSARMVPRGKQMPICMSKENDVQHGRIIVSSEALTTLFHQKLQANNKSKLSDVKVELKDGHVSITGKMHKVVGIPFTVEGPVDAPDGKLLRVHANKIKAAGIPVKGLLEGLGVELGDMINPGRGKGVTAKDDDLYFDPEKLGDIRGRISHVEVDAKNNLVVDFGSPAAAHVAKNQPPKAPAKQR